MKVNKRIFITTADLVEYTGQAKDTKHATARSAKSKQL